MNDAVSPLPLPEEMNAWDAAAARMGLSTAMLMENASREALHVLREAFGDLRGVGALCLAGPGNNGGDAVALARHLRDAGADVLLALAAPPGRSVGAPGFHLRLARRAGVRVVSLASSRKTGREAPRAMALALESALRSMSTIDIVADGLLGTGLAGEPRPAFAALIEAVNRLGHEAYVLALDIPSGLCGRTGRPASSTVRARTTVTFEAAKLGLAMPGAQPFTGEIHVRPIGIPLTVRQALPASHALLDEALATWLPQVSPAMHKGAAGKVLVAGGSPGLTGAPALAALGALRAGAGLVTVACPTDLEALVKAASPDVMTLPLGQGSAWSADMALELVARLEGFDALAVGPGLGRDDGARAFLEALVSGLEATMAPGASATQPPPPMVWDADALFWLASRPLPPGLAERCVFTPHPGEAARILGADIPAVEADRPAAVRALAARLGGAVILKGAGTLLCSGAPGDAPADGSARPLTVTLSPFSEPNLAVGGSGDVLSGLCASLLTRISSPLLAACLGVYWHGLAGRLLSEEFPYRGNLASEIAQALPRARMEWLDAYSFRHHDPRGRHLHPRHPHLRSRQDAP